MPPGCGRQGMEVVTSSRRSRGAFVKAVFIGIDTENSLQREGPGVGWETHAAALVRWCVGW